MLHHKSVNFTNILIQDNLLLTCVGLQVTINGGCYPTVFTVNGTGYHKFCDKARGYQRHTTDAFGGVGTCRWVIN